jgi:murein hydrolase activator
MFRALLLLALLLPLPPALAQDDDPRLARNQAELERVRSRIEALSRSLERDRGRQDELRKSLEDTEKKIASIAADLRSLGRDLDQQSRKVRATQEDQRRIEQQLAAQKRGLGRQIRSAYVMGEGGQTQLLLSQEQAGPLSRMMTYYDYLNRARARKIQGILEQVAQLQAVTARLLEERQALEQLRAQRERTLKGLEAGRAERAQMISRLAARIADEQAELKQLRQNEQEVRRLLDSLRNALADIPLDIGNEKPFAKQRGKLPWPARGRLLASFGQPKAGKNLLWNGLWIAAPQGSPVRAVAGGRVAYVGWMHRYGLIVVLEHEGGYFTLYGHNDSTLRGVGEWVAAGQPLAQAGASGGHAQPGVYFEVRKGKEPLNPRIWLSR